MNAWEDEEVSRSGQTSSASNAHSVAGQLFPRWGERDRALLQVEVNVASVRPLFSGCRKMFEAALLCPPLALQRVESDDDPATVEAKNKALGEFLALDPTGAGGSAYPFWARERVPPRESRSLPYRPSRPTSESSASVSERTTPRSLPFSGSRRP